MKAMNSDPFGKIDFLKGVWAQDKTTYERGKNRRKSDQRTAALYSRIPVFLKKFIAWNVNNF